MGGTGSWTEPGSTVRCDGPSLQRAGSPNLAPAGHRWHPPSRSGPRSPWWGSWGMQATHLVHSSVPPFLPGTGGQVLVERDPVDADAAADGRIQLSLRGDHAGRPPGPGHHPAAAGAGGGTLGDWDGPGWWVVVVGTTTLRLGGPTVVTTATHQRVCPPPASVGPGAVPRGGRAHGEAAGCPGEEVDAAAQ